MTLEVSRVSVREEFLEIPTYPIGPEDRNPPIHRDPRRWIYPYAMQDFMLSVKTVRRYRALILENEYIKVVVLPELGGRIYQVVDKTTGEEFFYCNHVVKPARIGLRGAWISGGVEFNFPNGHTVTTVSPVQYQVRKLPDGGASITVGDQEYVSRMSWSVTLTLKPGRAYIEEHVKISNPTPLPHRYWFWSNSAVHATPGLRFISPARKALTSLGIIPYPKFRGVDYSWYKAWRRSSDTFSLEADEDFFGWYLHDKDRGGVHIASRYEAEGKKMFTWGTDDAGMIWVDHLTESDGQYCEIQSGRFQTQMEYEFMEPHQVEEWVEYWYPIHGTDGFVYANLDAAVNLKVSRSKVEVAIYPTGKFEGSRLRVEVEGLNAWEWRLNLKPGEPVTKTIQTGHEDSLLESRRVMVTLTSGDGSIILSYTKEPETEKATDEAIKPRVKPEKRGTAEELYFKGLYMAKRGYEDDAIRFFDEALRMDPDHSQARIDRAVILIKRGLYGEAADELRKAIRRILAAEHERSFISRLNRYPTLDRAYYYLGLAYRLMGRLDEAEEYLRRLTVSRGYASLGFYLLGEAALLRGKPREALKMFMEAARRDPYDVKAKVLMAASLRRLGRLRSAKRLITEVLRNDPLNLMANFELMLVYEGLGLDAEAGEARSRVENLLYRPRNPIFMDEVTPPYYSLGHYFELAVQYEEAGLYDEAVKALEMGLDKPVKYTLMVYHLAYCLDMLGRREEAEAAFMEASRMSLDYVFPYHLESVKVLRRAMKVNPKDSNAMYLLGLLLYAKGRRDEAVKLWEDSLSLKPDNPLTHRNLGLAYWRHMGNPRRAINHYREALRLDPYNSRLYVEFDRLCEENFPDLAEERVKVIESAPSSVMRDDYVVERLVRAYMATGRYGDAYKLLTSRKFYPWEGATETRKLYRDVCIKLGLEALESGRPRDAVKFFKDSLEFPRNIGVGRPYGYKDPEALNLLASAYEAAGETKLAKRVRETMAKSEGLE